MRYSNITHTNLTASKIVLGTDSFGTSVDEQESFAILDRYVEAGGNLLDTASVYADWLGLGKSISEKTLGKWLKSRNNRRTVIISTKGGHYDLHTLASRLDYCSVREDFENSLCNLQTDYIDVYYLHKDDVEQTPENLIEMFQEAIPAEQAKYLGVSNWAYDRVKRANEHAKKYGLRPIIASQIQYSIAAVNRPIYGITAMGKREYDQYKKDNLNVFAFSSQASGFFAIVEKGGIESLPQGIRDMYLNEKNLALFEKLKVLSARKKETVPALVLAALTSDPNVNTFAQIGPRTLRELEVSLKGADTCLLEEDRRMLLAD